MPFQDLAKGFQGVDENGVPVPINPGKLNFDPTQVRVNPNGGVTQRVIVGGSEGSFRAIEDGPQRFRAEDLKPTDQGIVGTAKTISGAPRAAADLRADDIIDLGNGMKTTVAAAERIGAIRRGPDGYENVAPPVQPSAPQNAPQHATSVDPLSADVPVDEEFVGHVAVIQRGLPEVFVANAISEMVQHGQFSPDALHAAAKHLDTSPEIVLSTLQGALKATGAAYERYVSANGVRPADFTAFMQNQPETLALLMAKQASTGRTSVWAPMLRHFKASRR
jgi:hypothetical protein